MLAYLIERIPEGLVIPKGVHHDALILVTLVQHELNKIDGLLNGMKQVESWSG